MKKRLSVCLLTLCFMIGVVGPAIAQNQIHWDIADVDDSAKILPERERAEVFTRWLGWRLDNIIPMLMKREAIDMWVVINYEYGEDPVYMSMVAPPVLNARRLSILVFHNGPEGFKKLTLNWHGKGTAAPFYETLKFDKAKGEQGQWEALSSYIKKHDVKKIGINQSENWVAFGNGLTAGLKEKLVRSLDKKYVDRLVSAEHLCVGWLETRSPDQLSVYRHIAGISHDIIAEFFSNKVITPDVTTTDDVVWWTRDKITSLGLETWFQPSISIRRSPKDKAKYGEGDRVIRRGDILHCDMGIVYLGLCTDMQHNAYVCRIGEEEPPAGVKELLRKGNRLQEIFMNNFKEGRTGNEVLLASLKQGREEDLNPRIYTHPIGVHGHAAGTVLGRTEKQDGVPVRGDYPLHFNTVYSIELSVGHKIPEWDNALVGMGLEEEAAFTKRGCDWLDGYPREFYLIK